MSKTYLIESEKAEWQTYDDLLLKKADGKEVEVLDDAQVDQILCDSIESNSDWFSEYLKANKYLIVKIIE